MRRRLLRWLAFAAIAVAFPATAAVDEADPGAGLVRDFVTKVTTLRGRFQQSVLDANGVLVDASSGTIEIERPGRFRWATDDPYEQWVIADGVNVWSYDVDLAQVTVKPQADALSNTPALLLGGDSGALEDFTIEASSVDDGITWVRMTPADSESGFRRVVLGFEDGKLARMVFLDSLEQQTVVELSDVEYNLDLDPARFEFTPPDDVDIVGTPAAEETS
ncbi:MAG: outer membrane lipoprotein chaperone LolA [Woeseiaceae bacterium]|jgi:outer membrane lipoprotein carrier protein|nr:outer membrane lipoprotein chaperone LolA [Woeseiaceae bacterium]